MSINDHVSNLLARVRNAQTARFEQVEIPSTRLSESIAAILKEEGFIRNFRVLPDPKQPVLRIFLKADAGSGYAIKGMRRMSRPGRRVYVGKDDIPVVKSGFGIAILSTSKGVMTGDKARKMAIGGELLCHVW
ncbi:MAG: 30S ribosomal protein S8 [Gemmatimonadota bacterium]